MALFTLLPFLFSLRLFPHCYFLSFYKGTWLLWEISQPSSWLVDFQNKVGLFSSIRPLSEALACLADKQSDLELNHTTMLGTHVYTIHGAHPDAQTCSLPQVSCRPQQVWLYFSPFFFFYHFSMHNWATVLKQLRPLGMGIATENTQAANARALGTQYRDQEAGPPEKTCQELGTPQSIKGPRDLVELSSVKKSQRERGPVTLPSVLPHSELTRRYPSSLRHVAHQDLSLLISLSYIPHSCVQHSLLSSQFQDNLLSLILINEDNTLLLNSINSLLAESIFSWFLISDHIPPTTIPQITGPH